MSAYEFAISLRIRHPSVNPDEITHALGLEPQHMWQAGEQRRSPSGEALEGTYRESYWMAGLTEEPQLSSDPQSIESALMQALTHLRRSQQFLATLKADGGEMALQISVFSRDTFTLELSAELLSLLSRAGVAIAFDVNTQADRDLEA